MAVKTVVRDPDSKKRLILEAARRLLVERGFEDIVLDEVARVAGVAKGTLFLYYKSKEELLSAAMLDMVDALASELEALGRLELKGKDALIALAKVILNHFDRHRDFIGQCAPGRIPGCGQRGQAQLRERVARNMEAARRVLCSACADGGKSMGDLDFAAGAFFGLCRSAAMRKIFQPHDRPLEKEAEKIAGFFLNGSGAQL